MFNELATILLVAIVFLVIVKSSSGLLWGLLGTIAFAGILVLMVYVYKRTRESDKSASSQLNKEQSTTNSSDQTTI
jgi:putative membrane protein